MAERNEPWSDELISAYLDDEVSSYEREWVERVLKQDARCRQLYENLRSAREAVRELPRQRLDKDMSSRVLERIREQPTLVERRGTNGPESPLDRADTSSASGFRRGLVWAALAIAAALLLMFVQPRVQRDGRIAVAPPPDTPARLPNNVNEIAEADKDRTPTPGNRTSQPARNSVDEPTLDAVRPAVEAQAEPLVQQVPNEARELRYQPPPRTAPADTPLRSVEEGTRQQPLAAGVQPDAPDDAVELRRSATTRQFDGVLQADVTADQLPAVMASLREYGQLMRTEDLDFAATGRGVPASSPDGGDQPSVPSLATSEKAVGAVKRIVVQAALQDVQAALRQVHVPTRTLEGADRICGRRQLRRGFPELGRAGKNRQAAGQTECEVG